MLKKILVMIIFFSFHMHATIILDGDETAASDETFSFAIQQYRLSTSPELFGANLYVAADQAAGGVDNVKDFAVSRVTRDTTQFIGLTPKEVKLNRANEKIANPMYDQGIPFMALFDGKDSILAGAPDRPVVVTNTDRQTIYFINNFLADGKNVEILSALRGGMTTHNVPDATGAVTAGIVGLEAAAPHVFAAVRPAAGNFGDSDSGVALVTVASLEGTNGSFTAPIIVDAPTGSIVFPGGNRATPLDVSSSFLKIGNNLATIGSIIDMHWHRHINRLYIALQITGGAAGTDGGRAIVVGRIKDKTVLELLEIVTPTVFADGALDKIIGAQGANVSVSIQKVRGMFTSTALPYLIVQGNVGLPSTTMRSIFALPLVSTASDTAQNGTIANKNAEPVNVFSTETTIPLFQARGIQESATTPAQMPLSSDAATQVGAGILPDGDITDVCVYEDTVFVTVQTSDANEQPGVFYSQAMFEANGKIKSWTSWRRATGVVDNVQSVLLDPSTAQFSLLVANNAQEVKIVERTEWAHGDAAALTPVINVTNQFFLPQQAGIQGLFDFVVTSTTQNTATPGLFDISALVATGLHKVMLVQTSSVVAGGVIPVGGNAFGGVLAFENGTISQTLSAASPKIITIEGGVLNDLGPINAAEFARDGIAGANGYLFVGGVDGLAVLSNPDGSGWLAATGLSVGFEGLVEGMAFKKIGEYTNVRKLINDGQYLYVLTTSKLDRIDLTQGNVGLGIISPTTIATTSTIPGIGASGSFFDAIISDRLLLLATNQGLLRIANGLDVRTIDSNGIAWQQVDAPETVGPIRQLLAITRTGRAQNSATEANGSYILALSAFRGKNQAQIVRYSINPVTASGVVDSTVQRINDLFVENIPSYFVNFGSFRSIMATDGSLYFGSRNKYPGNSNAMVTVLHSTLGVQTGSRFLTNKVIPLDLNGTDLIAAIIQNSASGSWLVGSDQGMRANE